MSQNDPRMGLTSASNAEADLLCPGRHQAQKGIPDEKSEWASIGDRVHLALKGEIIQLADAERETVEKAKSIEENVLAAWINGSGDPVSCHREQRLWIYSQEGERLHSGAVDALWLCGRSALIEDFKSLFGEVQETPRNLQLRDLAVLVWRNYDVEKVTVFINQPRVTFKPDVVTYELDDLRKAHHNLVKRVQQCQKPDAKRVAGERQCRYCKVKAGCQEHQAWLTQVIEAKPTQVISREEQLTYYIKCKAISKVINSAIKSFEEKAKSNIEDWPEFILEETPGQREITRPQGAADVTSDVVPREVFMDCIKVQITALEDRFVEFYKKAFPDVLVKEAKAEFKKRVAPIVERKSRISLKMVKPVEEVTT